MRKTVIAFVAIFLLASICSGCVPSNKNPQTFVKPYQFENIQSNNLKKILEQNVQIFEINVGNKFKTGNVYVDVLEDGVMKTRVSMKINLSPDEANYLSIRDLGDGNFLIQLNGNSEVVSLSNYMDWKKELKKSFLGQQESLSEKVYLMTCTDNGKLVIEPQTLYDTTSKYEGSHIVVLRVEFS